MRSSERERRTVKLLSLSDTRPRNEKVGEEARELIV